MIDIITIAIMIRAIIVYAGSRGPSLPAICPRPIQFVALIVLPSFLVLGRLVPLYQSTILSVL